MAIGENVWKLALYLTVRSSPILRARSVASDDGAENHQGQNECAGTR
jgi:hypothetical protein